MSGRVMWKTRLMPGSNRAMLPVGIELVTAGLDGEGAPSVWFTADPGAVGVASVEVVVMATGDEVPAHLPRHLGTFSPEPGLIFHAWCQ